LASPELARVGQARRESRTPLALSNRQLLTSTRRSVPFILSTFTQTNDRLFMDDKPSP
jgi:hypothetical protein